MIVAWKSGAVKKIKRKRKYGSSIFYALQVQKNFLANIESIGRNVPSAWSSTKQNKRVYRLLERRTVMEKEIMDLNIKCPVLKGNRFRQYTARLEFIAKTEKALKELQLQKGPHKN